jgi:hypothetical protein
MSISIASLLWANKVELFEKPPLMEFLSHVRD